MSVYSFNEPIQSLDATTDDISISSSNEHILCVEVVESTASADSDFLAPIQDQVSEDESCSGLAEIQVCAVDLFSVHSNILSIPTDIRIFDYIDADESPEDDSDYDPLVAC